MAEIVEESRPFGEMAKDVARRFLRHENAVLAMVLVASIAGFSLVTGGRSIGRINVMNIMLNSSYRGVASIGQAFCMLSRNFDISIGGVALVCSILGGMLMTRDSVQSLVGYPMSLYMVIPIMLIAGIGWGFISGWLSSRIGMPSVVVTLGMSLVARGAAWQVLSIRGAAFIYELPEGLRFIGSGDVAGVPVMVIIFIVAAAFAYWCFNYTAFGRSLYATGGDPISAWLSGINVKNVQLQVFCISGFFAGLAAIMLTGRIMSASMFSATGLELDSITICAVGGVSLAGGEGGLIGVVLAISILGVVNNALNILGATEDMIGLVRGAILVAAVAINYMRRRE